MYKGEGQATKDARWSNEVWRGNVALGSCMRQAAKEGSGVQKGERRLDATHVYIAGYRVAVLYTGQAWPQ